MELKRVVVTGLGALTPLANTAVETWEAMKAGKSGIAPITLFDSLTCKTHFAGEVKNLDISGVIDRKDYYLIRLIDLQNALRRGSEELGHQRSYRP